VISEIFLDKRKVAELPTMNSDKFLDVIRIYLFNQEYEGWKEFKIKIKEEKKETKKRRNDKK